MLFTRSSARDRKPRRCRRRAEGACRDLCAGNAARRTRPMVKFQPGTRSSDGSASPSPLVAGEELKPGCPADEQLRSAARSPGPRLGVAQVACRAGIGAAVRLVAAEDVTGIARAASRTHLVRRLACWNARRWSKGKAPISPRAPCCASTVRFKLIIYLPALLQPALAYWRRGSGGSSMPMPRRKRLKPWSSWPRAGAPRSPLTKTSPQMSTASLVTAFAEGARCGSTFWSGSQISFVRHLLGAPERRGISRPAPSKGLDSR